MKNKIRLLLILDMLHKKTPPTHREVGETLQPEKENPTHTGAFDQRAGWQEVRFNQSVDGRYFCLEALLSQNGKELAAVAELEVLGADGEPISREQWKIGYADSEEVKKGNWTADKIFDLQESTCWMTAVKVDYPHHLVIDLGKPQTITGFRYLPSFERNTPGMIKDYTIYLKVTSFELAK